jgi:hypothetical protein
MLPKAVRKSIPRATGAMTLHPLKFNPATANIAVQTSLLQRTSGKTMEPNDLATVRQGVTYFGGFYD